MDFPSFELASHASTNSTWAATTDPESNCIGQSSHNFLELPQRRHSRILTRISPLVWSQRDKWETNQGTTRAERETHQYIHNVVCVRCLDVDCDWKCSWRDRRTYFARPPNQTRTHQQPGSASGTDTNYLLKPALERKDIATGNIQVYVRLVGFSMLLIPDQLSSSHIISAVQVFWTYYSQYPLLIQQKQTQQHVLVAGASLSRGGSAQHHYIHRILSMASEYISTINPLYRLPTTSHARYTHYSCWYPITYAECYGDAYMLVLLSNMSNPMTIKAWDLPWSGLGNWVLPLLFYTYSRGYLSLLSVIIRYSSRRYGRWQSLYSCNMMWFSFTLRHVGHIVMV